MGCLAVVLFAFWMALSGHTETKFIVYGVITALVTTWLTYPLLLVPNKEESRLYYVFGFSPLKMIWYFIWLMWQLVLANVDVLLAETSQELQIDPKVVRFYFRADNPMASTILANSITLTPGTVTMNVTDDGLYEIHALTKGAADGLVDGGMQRKVAWLYGMPLISRWSKKRKVRNDHDGSSLCRDAGASLRHRSYAPAPLQRADDL